jgi:tetratricopeptide (TPR) repeat protein
MEQNHLKDNPELAKLYRRYEETPGSHIFAPLADACRKAGLLQEAVDICHKGLDQHPDYSSGHVVMGKCLYDQGRFNEAEQSFRQVLGMDQENLVALKYLGMISAEQGDIENATRHFNHILKLDPDNREIREKLNDLDGEEEILELTPIKDERFEGEEIALGESDLETSDELATMTLADIFAAQGYRGKAIKIYEEVLGKDPANEAVRDKLQALIDGGSSDARESEEGDSFPWEGTAAGLTDDAWDGSITDDSPEPEEAGDERHSSEPEDLAEVSIDVEKRPQSAAARSAKKSAGEDESAIADEKSFNQFKRWLENADR